MTSARPIGDLVTIVGGGTPTRTKGEFYGGGVPWVTPKDMKTWDITESQVMLTEDGVNQSPAKVIEPNAVLVVVRSGILKHTLPIAVNRVPVTLNQDMKALICKPGLHPDYLARYLKWRAPEILGWVRATTADNFPVATLRQLEIPVPALQEQRRIAAILDQADALITTRREALRLVGMLSASVYDELFGDPTSNPRGWPRRRLRDVCDAINDCPHSTPRWTVAGEVCLRTSNLSTGGWDWSDTRYVSPQDYSVRSARAEIAPGDVILSREGTVGVAAIVEPGMRVCMGQRLVHVRTDRARVLPRFLLRTLLILLAPQRIGQVMVGSTSRHLNVRDLRSLEVVVPPLELQEQFDRAMARLEAAAEVAGRQILEAQSLQGALTELAFKGEL